MIVPTVWRGFSDEYGSWKIICISRRSGTMSLRSAGEVPAVELDGARGRLEQLDHRAAGRGLAAAALTDQAEGLAGADVEVDAVDRLDVADVRA